MSETLLQFALTALAYGSAAVALVWALERAGLLRDGVLAECAWRIALYGGLLVATVQLLQPTLRNLGSDLQSLRPAVALPLAPALQPVADVAATRPSSPATAMPAPIRAPSPTRSAPHTSPLQLPAGQAEFVVLLLLLLTGVALAAAGRALLRRQRYLRALLARSRAAPLHWQAHVETLDGASLYPVLRSAPALASPLCGDARMILLPDWAEALDADAQRALLAHELAHLRRRDPQWRLLDALVVALMAGLPPFRHAAARLAALAELACDAEAARRTRAPQALAECIAQCLEHQFAASPRLAVAMATPDSSVVERVQRLIEERPMFTSNRPWLRRSLITLAITAAFAVPAIAISVAADSRNASIQVEVSDGGLFGARVHASLNEAGRRIKYQAHGQVAFSETEDDIVQLGEGAEFSISEKRDGITRSLAVELEGGKLVRDYRVDGTRRDFDAAAKQWLAGLLPDVFRRTGLDAAARAKRIHARTGVDGLLAEVARVPADHARATYLGVLFSLATLDDAQTAKALNLAAAIESDFELRRALTMILERGKLTPTSEVALLAAAADIESDFERAELLIGASERIALDGERLDAWQKAARGIGSDFEQRRVLEALLEQRDVRPEHARLAIALASAIGSDYEKRMLLAKAARVGLGNAITRSEYTRVAATIGSDYERREALMALVRKSDVDAALALDVLQAVRDIGSDYEAKELLVALARVMPADAEVLAAYRSVARGLSTFERGEAEQALDRFVET